MSLCDRSLSLTDSVYNQNQFLLGKSCEKVGIPFSNLSDFVQNHEQNGNSMYWNYDGHLNERGTRLIAHEIYGKYSSLKKKLSATNFEVIRFSLGPEKHHL